MRDWQSGRVLHSGCPLPENASPEERRRRRGQAGTTRQDLLQSIINHVPKDCVFLGKKGTSLAVNDDSVTVHFHDGSHVEVDLVVVADGINSVSFLQSPLPSVNTDISAEDSPATISRERSEIHVSRAGIHFEHHTFHALILDPRPQVEYMEVFEREHLSKTIPDLPQGTHCFFQEERMVFIGDIVCGLQALALPDWFLTTI